MKHIKTATILILIVLGAIAMIGCGEAKYHVDYDGEKEWYKGAKNAYRAGDTVTLYYDLIATDTDYSFFLDGERLKFSYAEGKGFKISFVMPDHDVKLTCEMRNSMEMDPSAMINDGEITAVHLSYDMFSGNQFYLDAWVENITEDGAAVSISKRVGPMNYTGTSKDGIIQIDRAQVDTLLEILSRYDIEGYAQLSSKGTGSAPSRSIAVFYGSRMVDVSWSAKFPETVPPTEDIMYFELYNYFNDLVSAQEDWKEVWSDNLEDPRNNPAYYDRTVIQYGKEVSLVPGTGTYHEDGRGAEIDYGDKSWWLVEGFVGTWEMTEEDRNTNENTSSTALFTVKEDGSVKLVLDDKEYEGTLSGKRYYKEGIRVELIDSDLFRYFSVEPLSMDDYTNLRIYVYPGPVPEPQFAPIDVYVSSIN